MKLLVFGHAFLLAYNQRKYVALKSIWPDLKLLLVVPSFGRDRFHPKPFQIHPELSAGEVIGLKAGLSKTHMTYVHDPIALGSILRKFKPDAIHLEEEPQAFMTVEITLLRTLSRQARLSAFTWDNLLRPRRFPLGIAKEALRSYALHRIDTLICGNRRAAELVRAEGKFTGNLTVVPQYGIDEVEHRPGSQPQLRRELGLDDGIPVVGYVGRMVPEKGIRVIFAALKILRGLSWKLLLVGAGPLDHEIRERCAAEFPGRVVLQPAVTYEDVPRYIRCIDIYVLASYATHFWAEQFGLSMAQAMMLGIPCVASNSGAIPDVLGPGGLLFEENNAEELAERLKNLLLTPEQRDNLGRLGRQFAINNYSTATISAKYRSIFEMEISSDRLRETEPSFPKSDRAEQNMSLTTSASIPSCEKDQRL